MITEDIQLLLQCKVLPFLGLVCVPVDVLVLEEFEENWLNIPQQPQQIAVMGRIRDPSSEFCSPIQGASIVTYHHVSPIGFTI